MSLTPGTSVSLKGRQPLSTDSREVQYLSSILNAINNLSGVVAANASTSQIQSTATGTTTITLPAGVWLTSIAAEANTGNETINFGTTLAGNDIASSVAITTTAFKSVSVNKYFATQQIIYISGASGSVTYNFLISNS